MIGGMFETLISNEELHNARSKTEQFSEEAIKKLVVKEFRDAMSK